MSDKVFSLPWSSEAWPTLDLEEPLHAELPYSSGLWDSVEDSLPVASVGTMEFLHSFLEAERPFIVEGPLTEPEPAVNSECSADLSVPTPLPQPVTNQFYAFPGLQQSSETGCEARPEQAGPLAQEGDLLDINSIRNILFSDVPDSTFSALDDTHEQSSAPAMTERSSLPSSDSSEILSTTLHADSSEEALSVTSLGGSMPGRSTPSVRQHEAGQELAYESNSNTKHRRSSARVPLVSLSLQPYGRAEGRRGLQLPGKGRSIISEAAEDVCLDEDRDSRSGERKASGRASVPNLSIRLASIIDDLGRKGKSANREGALVHAKSYQEQQAGGGAAAFQATGTLVLQNAVAAGNGRGDVGTDGARECRKRLHNALAMSISGPQTGKLNAPGAWEPVLIDSRKREQWESAYSPSIGKDSQEQSRMLCRGSSSLRQASSASSQDKLQEILYLAESTHMKVLLLMDDCMAEGGSSETTSRPPSCRRSPETWRRTGPCSVPAYMPLEEKSSFSSVAPSPLACRLNALLAGSVSSPPALFFSESQLKERLCALATAMATQDKVKADILEKQLLVHADARGCALQRLCYQVLSALKLRAGATGRDTWPKLEAMGAIQGGATYDPLEDDTTGDALLESKMQYFARTPFVKFFFTATSTAVLRMIRFRKRIHIIDFGYMLGSQWIKAIRELGNRPCGPPLSMRITTVTNRHRQKLFPKQVSSKEAEQIAELFKDLERAAADAGIAYFEHKVVTMGVDNMSELFSVEGRRHDWPGQGINAPGREEREFLAVRACIDMESLPDGSVVRSNLRDSALSFFRQMQPDLFMLMGHNMDSNNPFYLSRFRECVDMYASAYDCHDETVLSHSRSALLFENVLHANSIKNIVACEGLQRVVRAERAEQWKSRMLRLGYQYYQDGFDESMQDALYSTTRDSPKGFSMSLGDGFAQLLWKDRPLVFVSMWHA